ncbi:alanine/glycine:cation symporter family protein [Pelistega ratti]|uniref:alanine/glycine:cation symporter family protein n=1 Tax=Pelistega ratti TaxID=2652177 RepID=UPI001358AC19|nr:alanine/glycine:cation symporter family protein [Pelistega ratti]
MSKLTCAEQASFLDQFHCYMNALSSPMWEYLVWVLVGVGLYFTLFTGFVQIRLFRQSVRAMLSGRQKNGEHGITAFQAFVTGLASRVGTGNIAGVAIAISTGGPGAVFWMWLTALIGMSSAFAESTLAQLFKVRDTENGQFRGGPAYYITHGLKQKWLAILFAISLIFCFGFVFNAIQSNTIVLAIQSAANLTAEHGVSEEQWAVYKHLIGAILLIITAPIIFGGIKRVARISEALVPVMALIYLIIAVYVVFVNASEIPRIIGLILDDAFSFKAAGGGLLGGLVSQAMLLGIKRGLFSNEAGMGSAPNAAAAADVKHPVSQGMIQMLGVFVDTIIVCSCTAFIILLAQLPADHGLDGIQLTQAALENHIGSWGQTLLAVILFMFCFSSVIGNYAYAESNIQFIKNNRVLMVVFRMLVLGFVYFGAVNKSSLIWDMGDFTMAIMSFINLVAIVLLSKWVFTLLGDYVKQLKVGKEPEFKAENYPALKDKINSTIW